MNHNRPAAKFTGFSGNIKPGHSFTKLIVRPDLWGRQARLRPTNVFGSRPVTFDGVFVGLQVGGAAVAKASNREFTF